MKWVKRCVIVGLLAIFLFSVGTIAITLYQYRLSDDSYAQAVDQFIGTAETSAPDAQDPGNSGGDEPDEDGPNGEPTGEDPGKDAVIAPLVVDFKALKAVNEDVVGWIYCEDTTINFPVLHGEDDDMYLHHLYDGTYCYSGSIFVEAINQGDFSDYNTIIYGHNMINGSMFGVLERWGEQEYYEEHPYFWLLTPEQDYRVDLLYDYNTSAFSDTYLIFEGEGPALDEYLAKAASQSLIEAKEKPEPGSRYVLFTTCAYIFDNARFVVHGKLVPVDSAGGVYKGNNDS